MDKKRKQSLITELIDTKRLNNTCFQATSEQPALCVESEETFAPERPSRESVINFELLDRHRPNNESLVNFNSVGRDLIDDSPTYIDGQTLGPAKLTLYSNFATSELARLVREIPVFDLDGAYLSQAASSPYLAKGPQIEVWGRMQRQPRNVGFFSDDFKGYRYSRQLAGSQPFTPWMRRLLEQVNKFASTSFNAILVNHYPNGADSRIAAHSDDHGLDKHNLAVAAISIGAVRTFRIKDKRTREKKRDVATLNGSLMIMGGSFQQRYTHEIPTEKSVFGPRWSLTFRCHAE